MASTRLASQPNAAKGHAILIGVAEKETGAAVEGATILLEPTKKVQSSDPIGRAAFYSLESGKYEVRVTRLGFRPLNKSLTITDADSVELIFFLRRMPVALDTAAVVARGGVAGFSSRRAAGTGRYLTDQEMMVLARGGARVADIMSRQFPGIAARWNAAGTSVALVSTRGPLSLQRASCTVSVYIDAIRAEGGDLASLRPTEIGGVEFYASSAPPEFAALGNTCGVLLIWRKA
jgi:hypothetical protein